MTRAALPDGRLLVTVALPGAAREARGGLLVVVEARAAGAEAIPAALEGADHAAIETRDLLPPPRGQTRDTRLGHFVLPARDDNVFHLRLGVVGGAAPPELARLRVYRLDERRRDDCWLFLGASLEAAAIAPDAMARELRERHPGFDPYVANEAVSGWTAGDLRRALPRILAEHRRARYVAIHIGGNDVSLHRPFPGAAAPLKEDVAAILAAVRAAGAVPILARLSFRAYKAEKGKPAVPPEANGALPYNVAVFDPLIRAACPDFFDAAAGRGRVDPYGYFKDHPDELAADGVHLAPAGSASWRRLWAEEAGDVVYGAAAR